MSIDVFGRQLTKNLIKGAAATRGPPGEGFRVTPDGQYDMNNKRLCNVGEPKEINDATSIKVARSIVKEETHALYQITKSLRDECDNISLLINSVQSTFENHQRTYRLDIDSIQTLATRNVESIQQLDSKLSTLDKTCNNIQTSIRNFEKILKTLEEAKNLQPVEDSDVDKRLKELENISNIIQTNIEKNSQLIREVNYRLTRHMLNE